MCALRDVSRSRAEGHPGGIEQRPGLHYLGRIDRLGREYVWLR
jgi:hypothetical protein